MKDNYYRFQHNLQVKYAHAYEISCLNEGKEPQKYIIKEILADEDPNKLHLNDKLFCQFPPLPPDNQ